MTVVNEFKDFLTKSNALALAIGVIVGAATGKMVSAVVDDLIMPLIAFILPAGDWREAQIILSQSEHAGKITVNAIKYGAFMGSAVDFVLISFVVFMITKALLPKTPPAPATKNCGECLEAIPEAAKRCKCCGQAA